MRIPVNRLKQALRHGSPQIGLWIGLAESYAAELLATTGFDWLLIDAEHAPNDPRTVLGQLQAVAAYDVNAVVRVPCDDTVTIKQYLDIGAQTLLVPMVETADQAARIVAATRYPTRGIRGVGSALARASRWNQVDGYLQHCEQEICVLVQVETMRSLQAVGAIAAVDGVDGVFFGASDLAASMGLLGQSGERSVRQAIESGITAVGRAGKAAGALTADPDLARSYIDIGARFVAVGIDTTLLVKAARDLSATFKSPRSSSHSQPNSSSGLAQGSATGWPLR